MTEMNKNTEMKSIHWTGFWTSLVTAPLLVGGSLWGPFYTHGALFNSRDSSQIAEALGGLIIIGTILYLIIGTPALIWHLHRHAPNVRRMTAWSLVSLFWMLPLGVLLSIATLDGLGMFMAVISMCFGVIGAPPLAAVFTLIYQRFPQR